MIWVQGVPYEVLNPQVPHLWGFTVKPHGWMVYPIKWVYAWCTPWGFTVNHCGCKLYPMRFILNPLVHGAHFKVNTDPIWVQDALYWTVTCRCTVHPVRFMLHPVRFMLHFNGCKLHPMRLLVNPPGGPHGAFKNGCFLYMYQLFCTSF